METKFQTSFIPKKPAMPVMGSVSPSPRRHTSIFMIIAVFVFILSLAGLGGAYAWKSYLTNSQASYKTQLSDREKQFNLDMIQQLKVDSVKIDIAKSVLQRHIALSQVFDLIGKMTIENVRFTNLDVTAPNTVGDPFAVSLSGYGINLPAVAFQSDVLGRLEQYGLRNIVKNPMMSDPALDTTGKVNFSLKATIDPKALSYEQEINGSVQNASSSVSQ